MGEDLLLLSPALEMRKDSLFGYLTKIDMDILVEGKLLRSPMYSCSQLKINSKREKVIFMLID